MSPKYRYEENFSLPQTFSPNLLSSRAFWMAATAKALRAIKRKRKA